MKQAILYGAGDLRIEDRALDIGGIGAHPGLRGDRSIRSFDRNRLRQLSG